MFRWLKKLWRKQDEQSVDEGRVVTTSAGAELPVPGADFVPIVAWLDACTAVSVVGCTRLDSGVYRLVVYIHGQNGALHILEQLRQFRVLQNAGRIDRPVVFRVGYELCGGSPPFVIEFPDRATVASFRAHLKLFWRGAGRTFAPPTGAEYAPKEAVVR